MAQEKGNVLLGLAALEVGTNISCDGLAGSGVTGVEKIELRV